MCNVKLEKALSYIYALLSKSRKTRQIPKSLETCASLVDAELSQNPPRGLSSPSPPSPPPPPPPAFIMGAHLHHRCNRLSKPAKKLKQGNAQLRVNTNNQNCLKIELAMTFAILNKLFMVWLFIGCVSIALWVLLMTFCKKKTASKLDFNYCNHWKLPWEYF